MKQASAVNFIPFTSTRIRSFVRSSLSLFLSLVPLFKSHIFNVKIVQSQPCYRYRYACHRNELRKAFTKDT